MKLTLLAFLTMLTFSSYASTCYISESTDIPDEYDKTITTISNIGPEFEQRIVLIHKDGKVDNDFNPNRYFEYTRSEQEYNQVLEELTGSRLVAISVDKEENQLTLATGLVSNETDNLFDSNVITIAELGSKKVGLFDKELKLAVYCIE